MTFQNYMYVTLTFQRVPKYLKMLKCYENLMTGQNDLKPMLRLGCPLSCKSQ